MRPARFLLLGPVIREVARSLLVVGLSFGKLKLMTTRE